MSFGYDNANRRTTLTLPNGIVVSYSYDNASQLIALGYVKGSTTLGNLTYAYDLNGRRANIGGSFAATNLPNSVSTTAYNTNNQLTTWGTANLFYDLNGNMTSDGAHSYAWDARNHLSTIDSGTTASFAYDPFGRRASKTILGTQTGFLYDGANPLQELSGTTVIANSLMGGVDEVFQRTDSVGARSFLTDALTSTIALTDSTGTLQTQYTFDPFGNTTPSGLGTTNSFAYTGRELDSTGLYFYRARYYSPGLQRFISEDPIGLSGGINTYAYVSNSPLNFNDSWGLDKHNPFDRARRFWNWFKDVNRRAAVLSQAGSLNKITNGLVPKLVGSNVFGDIASLAAGPEPGTDPAAASIDRVDQAASVATEGAAHVLEVAAEGTVVDTFVAPAIPISSVAGVYNPITLSEVGVTAGETTLGGIAFSGLVIATVAKIGADALVYGIAFGMALSDQ